MATLLLLAQILIVAPGIRVEAPAPPPKEEALRVLATAPGISNLTGWRPAPPAGPRVVFVPQALPARPAPGAPPAETEAGRANRMGIPGGWTPLEWATLHGGGLTKPSSNAPK